MAAADHFNLDLHQQNNLKHNSFSNMDLLNNIGNAATAIHENFCSSNINDNGLMVFSNDHPPHHPQQRHHHHQLLPMLNFGDANIQSSFHAHHDPPAPPPHLRGDQLYDPVTHFVPTSDHHHQGPSLEPDNIRVNNSSLQINFSSVTSVFAGETKTSRNFGYGTGGRKRKRNNERVENEKPREVVHVRARRGQATDSHSLAERLRREKINEKMRCLQDLVPGCYKTMGTAVMLDVVINYVRSLQNQIEFLSMKLSAASLFYDFNSSEMEALDSMQGTNGYEPQVMERMVGEGYGGGIPQFPSNWPL